MMVGILNAYLILIPPVPSSRLGLKFAAERRLKIHIKKCTAVSKPCPCSIFNIYISHGTSCELIKKAQQPQQMQKTTGTKIYEAINVSGDKAGRRGKFFREEGEVLFSKKVAVLTNARKTQKMIIRSIKGVP